MSGALYRLEWAFRHGMADTALFISQDGGAFWVRTVEDGKHIQGEGRTIEDAIIRFLAARERAFNVKHMIQKRRAKIKEGK